MATAPATASSASSSSLQLPGGADVIFRGQLHKKSEWSNSWSLREVCLSRSKLIYTHVWRADPGVLPVADILRAHQVLHDPCRFTIETKSQLLMHFRTARPEQCTAWLRRIRASAEALEAERAARAAAGGAPASAAKATRGDGAPPADHLRVPIMIREGAEVVGRCVRARACLRAFLSCPPPCDAGQRRTFLQSAALCAV
jgi:hypothetical protein